MSLWADVLVEACEISTDPDPVVGFGHYNHSSAPVSRLVNFADDTQILHVCQFTANVSAIEGGTRLGNVKTKGTALSVK